MKSILVIILVVAVALFTGTWIFDLLAWSCDALAIVFRFLSKLLNLFGWNTGIIAG